MSKCHILPRQDYHCEEEEGEEEEEEAEAK